MTSVAGTALAGKSDVVHFLLTNGADPTLSGYTEDQFGITYDFDAFEEYE